MVLLRKYRMEDVDSIARHAGNEKVARWMRDSFPHPYTRQDAETFIASCIAREGQGQLVRTIGWGRRGEHRRVCRRGCLL